MKYYLTLILSLVLFSTTAQNVAIKSNLLYDATATVNLGVEFGVGKRSTIDMSGNYNAWYTDKAANEKIRHWLFQPEFRYYTCERFSGHFFGAHAICSEFNVNGSVWLLDAIKRASSLNDASIDGARYQGAAYGGGLVYGYDWMLCSRLNLEFCVGVGYLFLDYERYGADTCAAYEYSDTRNYWGVTKLGVSLVYLIK